MTHSPPIPVKPLPIKERSSILFVEKGQLDVLDGAFVLIDKNGVRMQIPIGGMACIMLEPGIRISHAAVSLAAKAGTLLIWVGDGGVRLYAAGQPGGARSDRLLHQARLALDPEARLKVVRKMYEIRFGEKPPERRSIDQLKGIEGARVRKMYQLMAKRYGFDWNHRNYDVDDWQSGDLANRCLSTATSCLYGITEAAVLAAGYSPGIGFIHSGKPLSFVYDIADLFKFETVVPLAFKIAKGKSQYAEKEVRYACRDIFKESKILQKLIPLIQDVLSAGELPIPEMPEDVQPIAIPNPEQTGDDGHRS